jgi:GNAT superfamily N-acetyltransferase
MISVTEITQNTAATGVLAHLGLPQTLDGAPARLWMARDGAPAAPAAGFAVRWSGAHRHWLWLHVAEPARRQGVGSALLEAVRTQAAPNISWRLVDAVDASHRDWFVRHGFVSWGHVREYAFDLEASARGLERIWQRLKHRIPPQADMLSLEQAHHAGWTPEIARLQAQAVGGLPSMLQERMARAAQKSAEVGSDEGTDEGISLPHSLVIVLGGELVAFALARFDDALGCWMIDGFYVASAFRDGWATLWLRYELVQTGLRLGRTPQYRVRARNDQTNTVAFARRLGAQALEARYLMEAPQST